MSSNLTAVAFLIDIVLPFCTVLFGFAVVWGQQCDADKTLTKSRHWLLLISCFCSVVAEVVLDVMPKQAIYRSTAHLVDRNHFGGHP